MIGTQIIPSPLAEGDRNVLFHNTERTTQPEPEFPTKTAVTGKDRAQRAQHEIPTLGDPRVVSLGRLDDASGIFRPLRSQQPVLFEPFIRYPLRYLWLDYTNTLLREIPVMQQCEGWRLSDEPGRADGPLFLNARGRRLTRSGIAYILRKLAERAELSPRHARRVTPHVVRHTTAMHLLQAGVDITTIAAWLGHSQLATTHGYIEIDLRMKQKAIAATAVIPEMARGEYPEGQLLAWLAALGKPPRYVLSPAPTTIN